MFIYGVDCRRYSLRQILFEGSVMKWRENLLNLIVDEKKIFKSIFSFVNGGSTIWWKGRRNSTQVSQYIMTCHIRKTNPPTTRPVQVYFLEHLTSGCWTPRVVRVSATLAPGSGRRGVAGDSHVISEIWSPFVRWSHFQPEWIPKFIGWTESMF